ncbi:hypothetical protein GOP47_0008045 [Adiantum capillus-veneris]|uniref:Uncharacterized protein n=1 Tax=Adiantum capillus-veneris TaxID=13818 RepID=A0A9D4UY68_ADICA|nr:hypothetical protein GOP47_0008045 [Adiantum capillus-veneris]
MEAFQREDLVAQSMLQKDQLLLENENLKQQLALLKASSSRPNIAPTSTRPEARSLETEGTVQQEMPPEEPISAPATEPEPTIAKAVDKELTLNELAELQLRERMETLHERYH